jgi:tRNA pseudouridine55 synthase
LTADTFHGLLVIDKPAACTSRAIVDRAQRWFPRGTRIGHTGTLDPLATGVLVLCVGVATRLTEYVQRMAKTYRAGIILGATSDTDDADGTITPMPAAPAPTAADVRATLQSFVGAVDQVPPAYSAAHVGGRRAYDLARRGHDVDLAARRIMVHAIEVERYEYPHLELVVHCGKGTYIRSLARDLGARLGCGGYIASLRRTRIGGFDVSQALPLDCEAATARQHLLPLHLAVADLLQLEVPAEDARLLRHGQLLPVPSHLVDGQEAAAFDERGELVAIVRAESKALRPDKVFNVGNTEPRA